MCDGLLSNPKISPSAEWSEKIKIIDGFNSLEWIIIKTSYSQRNLNKFVHSEMTKFITFIAWYKQYEMQIQKSIKIQSQ